MKVYLLCFVLYFASSVCGLSKFCSKNEQCPDSSTCQNGLCVCDIGKVNSLNGNKCLEMASGIGSSCAESTQCTVLVDSAAICNSQEICSCDSGYVYLNNQCVKYLGFNETCNADTLCYDGVDLFAMQCDNGRCGCSDGYYMRGEYDCRKSAKDDGKCLFDIDCEVEDQYCDFKYGPLGDCKVGPDIPCETNEECTEQLENSFCAEFRQKKCTCNDDFLYDKENNECIPDKKANEPKDSKEPESDEPEKKIMEYDFNLRADVGIDKPCYNETDCEEVRNSFCAPFRNKCTCNETFIYDKNSGNCVRGLGSTCLEIEDTNENSTETECGVKHSFCNKDYNVCQCPKYFVYSPYSNKCFKPTREFNLHSCGSDENCYAFGPFAECTKSTSDITTTCRCKSNTVYDKENNYCKPLSGVDCKDNCKNKLHSKCMLGECICEDNYIEEDLKCLPDLGYSCNLAAGDCVIDNAECEPNTKICQCKADYFKTDSRECLKVIEDPEEKCTSDEQCFKFLNEGGICFNQTCTCASTHVIDKNENKCELIRSIGDQCSNLKQCRTMLNSDHVLCLNGKCLCDYDYHFSKDASKCVNNGASSLSGREIIFFIILLVTTLFFFW